jgi:uncharacterized protein YbjT (DUF2867 family)
MIIVTGAGGTVGREVVAKLRETDTPFRACFNSASKADEARAAGIDAAVLDFARPESLAPAIAGGTTLFLLSPSGRTELELNALAAARRAGIRWIVKLSAWGAPGEGYRFARGHHAIEREIEQSGLAFTFLRPNGFMQNSLTAYAPTVRKEGAFYAPAGDARVSFIDVRDIGRVAATVLSGSGHEGKAYGLSGPEAPTHAEIAEKLSSTLGKAVRYVNLPDDAYLRVLGASGLDADTARAIVDLYGYYRRGEAAAVLPDVEQITGRSPITFECFIHDHLAAFGGPEAGLLRD